MSVVAQNLEIDPAERRFLSRQTIYEGDGIICEVVIHSKRIQLRIQDLSPEGVCAVDFSGTHLIKEDNIYDLIIRGPDSKEIIIKALLLNSFENENNSLRLGFKFINQTSSKEANKELRFNYRFNVHNLFPPTGMSDHPLFFGEKIFFRIENFSAGGMRVSTSLRLKSLIPGQHLSMSLQIPTQINQEIHCSVRYTLVREDKIILGLQFEKEPKKIHEALGEYIFSMTD